MRVALVHYHEIGLKGLNRSAFERRLQDNLSWALRDVLSASVHRIASRLLVRLRDEKEAEAALRAIAVTPGVSYLGYGLEVEQTKGAMDEAAVLLARDEIACRGGHARTFGVEARRSATDYAESSMEMNRRIGQTVRLATGLAVDLSRPDVRLRVEVVQGAAYLYARRIDGPGGLPVGTAGRVVALLSAGIDSPVAAWRVMRRGASVHAVHFSGRPQTSGRSEEAVASLAGHLAACGGLEALHVVPFGDVQRTIALATPPDLRVLLYRRFMLRVAEAVAREVGAKALVTGESLGQVASQTLDNIAVVDAAATLPVLRPLVGSDKQEIVTEARRLETLEASTESGDDDCCTLFMPRRPETHATPEEAAAAEQALDVPALVAEALAGVTITRFPSVTRPRRTPAEATR